MLTVEFVSREIRGGGHGAGCSEASCGTVRQLISSRLSGSIVADLELVKVQVDIALAV